MQRKRNGFLTFCLSCLPGAGHMFLGFFKEGISLMLCFFFLSALAGWLEIDGIFFLLPVIWFYSFFDALNKNSLPDEDFAQLEDHYFFVNGLDDFKGFSFSKYRTAIAVLIIILGINLLCNNVVSLMATFGFTLSYEVHQVFFRYIPQMTAAVLIIAAGIYLISGKKQALKQDVSEEDLLKQQSNEKEGGGF